MSNRNLGLQVGADWNFLRRHLHHVINRHRLELKYVDVATFKQNDFKLSIFNVQEKKIRFLKKFFLVWDLQVGADWNFKAVI